MNLLETVRHNAEFDLDTLCQIDGSETAEEIGTLYQEYYRTGSKDAYEKATDMAVYEEYPVLPENKEEVDENDIDILSLYGCLDILIEQDDTTDDETDDTTYDASDAIAGFVSNCCFVLAQIKITKNYA